MQEHDILSKPYTFFVLPYILDKFLAFFFVAVLFFCCCFIYISSTQYFTCVKQSPRVPQRASFLANIEHLPFWESVPSWMSHAFLSKLAEMSVS